MDIAKNLLEQIDLFKQKLTDEEYLKLSNTLLKLSKHDSNLYEVTIYIPKVSEELIEGGNIQILENPSTTVVNIQKIVFISKINFSVSEHETINEYNKKRFEEMLKGPVKMCSHDLDIFKHKPNILTMECLECIVNVNEDGDSDNSENYTKVNKYVRIDGFLCSIRVFDD